MANRTLAKRIQVSQSAIKKPHLLLSYLNVPEVANELGADESHVRDLIHGRVKGAPRLVAIKTGRGKYLVSVFSLMFWAQMKEGWRDEETRRKAEKATRNCRFTARQILAGNVDGAIPNFRPSYMCSATA